MDPMTTGWMDDAKLQKPRAKEIRNGRKLTFLRQFRKQYSCQINGIKPTLCDAPTEKKNTLNICA